MREALEKLFQIKYRLSLIKFTQREITLFLVEAQLGFISWHWFALPCSLHPVVDKVATDP
jgi:hypothetical protein